MTGQRWTVLLVPEGADGSKELRISSGGVRALFATAALVAAVTIGGVYAAITTAIDMSQVGRLERRNETLEGELARMETSLTALSGTIEGINERDRQVRLLAGLEPNDPDVQRAGVGGPAAPLNAADRLLIETPLGRDAVSMRDELANLIRRAHLLSGSFKTAVDTMLGHQNRLGRTPSIMPTTGFLSSGFSLSRMHPVLNYARAHQGIDLVASRGTPIVSAAAGRVVDVGRQVGYGLIVTIDHGDGIRTRYAHCSEILVEEGQVIQRGDQIALVGETGIATNSHLHYEVLVNGEHVDPRTFIFGDVIVD